MNFPDLDRITIDPRVMGGKPCIRGILITFGAITGLLACGESIDSVLALYLSLEREDIYAALAYATWRAEENDMLLKADDDDCQIIDRFADEARYKEHNAPRIMINPVAYFPRNYWFRAWGYPQ
jgi:uncharacterized protein (DUF433 family)